MSYSIKNSLEIIIDDLAKTLSEGCLFSSLALALTIPDICGKAKHPDLKTGERYKSWYDEYIGNYEKHKHHDDETTEFSSMPYLSGELVYKLRCSFLHSGGANLENDYDDFRLDNFVLRIEKKNEFDIYIDESSINSNPEKSQYIVNIRRLCCTLMWAAQAFLRKEGKEVIARLERLKIQYFDKELKNLKFNSINSHLSKYKIVSWNCNGKFREKFEKIKSLNADIYLIQECEDPNRTKVKKYKEWASNYIWIGKEKNKGLGVFARDGIVLENLKWESLCLKYFIPLKVNDKFNLLAVWTQNPYIEEYYLYQCINKSRYDDKTILFGDFNSNKRFDNKYITRKERGHTSTVYELTQLGFVDAYHYLSLEEQGEETINTFYLYRHLDKGFHIDHCFINPEFLKSYQVLDDGKRLKYSDHMPCILEIKIP